MKVTLITGASSGIGHALALLLAEKGHHLILMARRQKLLDNLKSQIILKFPQCRVVLVESDVSDYEKHMKDVSWAITEMGRIDWVIANAGIGRTTIEDRNNWKACQAVIEVNLLGAIATFQAAKDFMIRQGQGQLIGVTSLADVRGLSTSSAYCASKSGLSTFMEAMRIDLKPHGIAVTAIHPGFVETPMTEKNGSMPFIMNAEKAAQKIYRAIERRRSRFVFPWQMAIVHWIFRVMPHSFFDFLMTLFSKKAKEFKKNRD